TTLSYNPPLTHRSPPPSPTRPSSDLDRRTRQQRGRRYVAPHQKSQYDCPNEREVIKRHYRRSGGEMERARPQILSERVAEPVHHHGAPVPESRRHPAERQSRGKEDREEHHLVHGQRFSRLG